MKKILSLDHAGKPSRAVRMHDRTAAACARGSSGRRAGAPALPLDPGTCSGAHTDALAVFGRLALGPGDYRWAASIPEEGETRVVIDLLTQLFYVYRADQLVGVAAISSGKKGLETPLGFWAVMRKQKLGRSRKYDNAPMPFMQMYDDKGIAFHAGKTPAIPPATAASVYRTSSPRSSSR